MHCERLVEDVEDKPVVHAFMEALAKKLNRKMVEEDQRLQRPITADDIELSVTVNIILPRPVDHINVTLGLNPEANVRNTLEDMHK